MVGDSVQDEAGLPSADGKHERSECEAPQRGEGEGASKSVYATKAVALGGT